MGADGLECSASPRRDEVLAFVSERIARSGICPSYEEIGRSMIPPIGKARVKALVDQLVKRGRVSRAPGAQRGIHVLAPYTSEHLPLLPLIIEGRALD